MNTIRIMQLYCNDCNVELKYEIRYGKDDETIVRVHPCDCPLYSESHKLKEKK